MCIPLWAVLPFQTALPAARTRRRKAAAPYRPTYRANTPKKNRWCGVIREHAASHRFTVLAVVMNRSANCFCESPQHFRSVTTWFAGLRTGASAGLSSPGAENIVDLEELLRYP